MLQFRRTFQDEKVQLQELNQRLAQYLSRVKQLERENAQLVTQISALRSEQTTPWERQYLAELRELRETINCLAFDRSRAQLERDGLQRELRLLQELLSQESGHCRDIDWELRGCEKLMQQAHQKNVALEEQLLRLEDERQCLEESGRREVQQLREEVHSQLLPFAPQGSVGAPSLTMEDVEEYALSLSQCCMENFEVYRQRIEELEASIKLDQQRQETLRQEKEKYGKELELLSRDMDEQRRLQLRLHDQMDGMQDQCEEELLQYQELIRQLEEERRALALAIAEKLKDHQELMQVKMGLSMEVAAYRALLEGEKQESHYWIDQYEREIPRKAGNGISIQTFTAKRSPLRKEDGAKSFPVSLYPNRRYAAHTSSMKVTSKPSQPTAYRVSTILPAGVTHRGEVSTLGWTTQVSSSSAKFIPRPAERKYTEIQQKVTSRGPAIAIQNSGNESRISPSAPVDQKPTVQKINIQKEEIKSSIKVDPDLKLPEKANDKQAKKTNGKVKEVIIVKTETQEESVEPRGYHINLEQSPDSREVTITLQAPQSQNSISAEKEHFTSSHSTASSVSRSFPDTQIGNKVIDEPRLKADEEEMNRSPIDKKILNSINVEDILEKVVRPAGLETTLSSSPDSKITYHLEKTKEEDGSTKTEIILQSTVQEELDVSDDSLLEELLRKDVKRAGLQDIKGTPAESMIENILGLGLKGRENASVNVEIIEEPLEAPSGEENEESQSSMFFHIEELDNAPLGTEDVEVGAETLSSSSTPAGEFRNTIQFQVGATDHTQVQETEYFVSTPDDATSEHEGVDVPVYKEYLTGREWSEEGHYWQEEPGPVEQPSFTDSGAISFNTESNITADSAEFRTSWGEQSYPEECSAEYVIEEEIHVPHNVQRSVLELLREGGQDPRQQITSTLEQLKESVPDNLREELSFLSDVRERSDQLEVDVRKVQQSSDSGVVTIVAEINVSQSLDDSGLANDEKQADSDLEYEKELHTRVGEAFSHEEEEEEEDEPRMHEATWARSLQAPGSTSVEQPTTDINKSVRLIKLGPSEKSFTFQMDVSQVTSMASGEGNKKEAAFFTQREFSNGANGRAVREDVYQYVQSDRGSESQGHQGEEEETWDDDNEEMGEQDAFSNVVQQQKFVDPRSVISKEHRIAALYLDESDD
ncbi:synemin [Polypterus senegalus]|uniref:synemin n=1 Tax=Polypterus senegalus TaxID=55291 RepID=UPI001964C225|nr:synemin [Polypterus senegalus]